MPCLGGQKMQLLPSEESWEGRQKKEELLRIWGYPFLSKNVKMGRGNLGLEEHSNMASRCALE